MKNRSVNISSLVILLSLLSFMAEICIYYLINYHAVCLVTAIIFAVGIGHFCLESSLNYGYNFLHSAFMVTACTIFAIVIYLIQPNRWIHYDYCLVYLVLLNWLVPFIYAMIRSLIDQGPRFDGYHIFFQRMSILFAVVFVFAILKEYFITPLTPPYEELVFGAHNFVPFMASASYMEIAIRNHLELAPLLLYILKMVCMGIPAGFFTRVYTDSLPFPARLGIYFGVPIVLEILQELTGRGWGDIDDVTMSMFGVLIGVILYYIMNLLFQSVSNREFTVTRSSAKYFQ